MSGMKERVILASRSPRRKELIGYLFDEVEFMSSQGDETYPAGLSFDDISAFLAVGKCRDIANENPDALVIGADTGVFYDGEMLGKPENREDAKRMLTLLSGKSHTVITGCCLCKNGKTMTFSEKTAVTFYPLTEEEIDAYIATKECDDKAGSYGIQGKGGLFVKEIIGDYYNVVGLPVARLKREIDRFLNTIK